MIVIRGDPSFSNSPLLEGCPTECYFLKGVFDILYQKVQLPTHNPVVGQFKILPL
jgi:hypothetical protein